MMHLLVPMGVLVGLAAATSQSFLHGPGRIVLSADVAAESVLFPISTPDDHSSDASVYLYPFWDCRASLTSSTSSIDDCVKSLLVPADTCVDVPALTQGLETHTNAVCADGQPARLVKYTSPKCDGELDRRNLDGEDILSGGCVDLLGLGYAAKQKKYEIQSFAFVCDGRTITSLPQLDVPIEQGHEPGQSTGGFYQRYVDEDCSSRQPLSLLQPETCLDVEEHNSLHLSTRPICEDGSLADFTLYSKRHCWETSKMSFALDVANPRCINVGTAGSMKWSCSSSSSSSPTQPSALAPAPAKPLYSEAPSPALISKLAADSDSGPIGGRFQRFSASESCHEPRMPLFLQPDKCLAVSFSRPKLLLGSAAMCANGTEARFEIYEEDDCWDGDVAQRSEAEDVVGTCLNLKKEGSVAWVCDGVPQKEGKSRDRKKKSRGHASLGSGAWVGIIFGILGAMALVSGVVLALHRPAREAVMKIVKPGYGPISLE